MFEPTKAFWDWKWPVVACVARSYVSFRGERGFELSSPHSLFLTPPIASQAVKSSGSLKTNGNVHMYVALTTF